MATGPDLLREHPRALGLGECVELALQLLGSTAATGVADPDRPVGAAVVRLGHGDQVPGHPGFAGPAVGGDRDGELVA
ncbi:hypothetical protein [Saccharopolyspora phatthalungensis]|uniref:Uncharacterized protein n=1 Tax=Saccharopolyspora phatthalungensis TaxID=664693 RepID=A0A840Q705_9PSEU|nr:hypothetical protein [Saccharopolyspora phatthalungensis]MBB5158282.1 hypothetical protein [Saccharopolyspora phatthalungensis]